MTYGLVLGILFVHIGFMLSLLAFWLGARALAPALVTFTEVRTNEHPIRQFFIGVGVGLPLVLVGLILANAPAIPGGAPLGAGLLLIVLLLGLLGSAGIAQRVGRGLPAPVDEAQPWRRVLRGGLVICFTLVFPLLGWFILLPLLLTSGLGAVASFTWRRRPATAAETALQPTAG